MGKLALVRFISGTILVITAATGGLVLPGCASTGIAIREKFGYAKREQLVDRVESARDSQDAAKEQFADALEEFLAVTGADTGDLEDRYASLKRAYDRSESKAETVRDRIRSVERVADALFKEWEQELGQYESESLRAASRAQLSDTRSQYDALISVMRRAESRMDPVLRAFSDQVLFLKHNLNARAISSLRTTAAGIESDVATLIEEMNRSIAEADAFIKDMNAG